MLLKDDDDDKVLDNCFNSITSFFNEVSEIPLVTIKKRLKMSLNYLKFQRCFCNKCSKLLKYISLSLYLAENS